MRDGPARLCPPRLAGRSPAAEPGRTMGSADSKLNFRKAVIQLTTKTQVRAAMSGGG